MKAFNQTETPIQPDTRRQAVKVLDGPLIDAWMRAQTDDGRAFVLLQQIRQLRELQPKSTLGEVPWTDDIFEGWD